MQTRRLHRPSTNRSSLGRHACRPDDLGAVRPASRTVRPCDIASPTSRTGERPPELPPSVDPFLDFCFACRSGSPTATPSHRFWRRRRAPLAVQMRRAFQAIEMRHAHGAVLSARQFNDVGAAACAMAAGLAASPVTAQPVCATRKSGVRCPRTREVTRHASAHSPLTIPKGSGRSRTSYSACLEQRLVRLPSPTPPCTCPRQARIEAGARNHEDRVTLELDTSPCQDRSRLRADHAPLGTDNDRKGGVPG